MLAPAPLVAFVATTDLELAEDFYGTTLGLPVVERLPIARVFDANGTQLRVTLVERLEPAPHTVLGWNVADISDALLQLSQAGVQALRYPDMIQDEWGVWDAPSGARVAWFQDPSGNVLSVSQHGGAPSHV